MMKEQEFRKLCTDIAEIKTKLEGFMEYVNVDICNKNDDHEKRLRSIESFKSKFIGAIIVGNFLAGILAGIIVAIISKG